MEEEGFGVMRIVYCLFIFFKKLLEFLINEEYKFGKYNIIIEDY